MARFARARPPCSRLQHHHQIGQPIGRQYKFGMAGQRWNRQRRAAYSRSQQQTVGLPADALDADASGRSDGERAVELDLPIGMTFDMTADQFARDWALGQFMFHAIAAYAILRKEGVEIGKADYVPHMFAYLRAAG